MRRLLLPVSIVLLLCAAAAAQDEALNIDVKEKVLENGLKILVVERKGTPEVVCRLFYNVGSANEVTGITGLSHLCEHMMFKGTKVIGTKDPVKDAEYNKRINEVVLEMRKLGQDKEKNADRLAELQKELDKLRAAQKKIMKKDEIWQIYMQNGATGMNAFTSNDFTGYIVTVPSNKLELFFWLESDRMANAVFREFYSELDVVREERRLTENRPTGFFGEAFNAIVYDAHPYSWSVVGWMVDLDNMTLAKAKKYHDTYYIPNNAVVVLVGDLKAQDAFKMAEKYFGRIPGGPDPPPVVTVEHPQRFEKRLYGEIDTQPYVTIAYHVPSVKHEDSYVLQVLSQVISGNTGVLYKEIVRKKELATSCSCGFWPSKFPGTFTFHGSTKGTHTPEEVEKAIYAIIESLKSEPVAQKDLERAKKQLKAQQIRMLASNEYLAFMLAGAEIMDSWKRLLEAPAKLAAVTTEDIMRVAKKYFVKTNRTVGIVTQPKKASGPYLTVLVGTIPRSPEVEAGIERMKGFISQQFPDFNVRMDEKTIYAEIGRFDLDDRAAAEKRLKEIQEHQMAQMLPAPPKIVAVGVEEEKKEPEKPEQKKEEPEKKGEERQSSEFRQH
jgi:predicted Zn-dependent peptidase